MSFDSKIDPSRDLGLGVWLVAGALAVALTGCAGVHLHDAEREKMVQGARKSFDTADVKATIVAARENHAALTEAEVAQARRIVEVRRDLLLHAIADDQECVVAPRTATATPPAPAAPPATPRKPFHDVLQGCIDAELSRLVVIKPDVDPRVVLEGLRTAVITMETQQDAMATDRARVRVLLRGLELPACAPGSPLPAAAPPPLVEEAARRAPDEPLAPHYSAFVRKCQAFQDAHQHVLDRATGQYLKKAAEEWRQGRVDLDAARTKAQALKGAYQEALGAYEAAAAGLAKEQTKEVRAAFDQATTALKKASQALEAGGPFGVKLLSEERLADLDAIIAATNGDQIASSPRDPGLGRSVAALATLPTFTDRAIDIARRRQAPPLGPLLLEKELHHARLTAANRQVVRAEARVAWLERRLAAQRDRAIRLLDARRRLDGAAVALAEGAPCNGDVTCGRGRVPARAVDALSDAAPPAARARLQHSVIGFADSFSIDATEAAEADYRLVALHYESALDRSEDAVKEWQTMIAVPVDRLIAYYGSGIRPAEVAALLVQALGMGAIGVGVNR